MEVCSDESIRLNNTRKAMLIYPIIRCVLKHLSFIDLKTCSQISKEWNSVSRPLLRNRSRVSFCKSKGASKDDRSHVKFMKEFSKSLEPVLPFTSYMIYGSRDPWKISELEDLFEIQKMNMRELSLTARHLVDENGDIVDSFDISPLILGTAFNKPKATYDSKLHVHSSSLILQTCVLANVKELVLKICKVVIQDGFKISPVYLALMNVTFLHNGIKSNSVVVNDIFNFSKAKSIILIHNKSGDNGDSTEIYLDLNRNGGLVLEQLYLSEGIVQNWISCRWTTKELSLYKIPFLEKTGMLIQEMYFNCAKIDLSVLPESLEKLGLGVDRELCFCSSPIVMSKLRVLILYNSDCLPMFFELVTCPNLVVVSLCDNGDHLIDLALLPKSVKKLKLIGVRVKTVGDSVSLNLDKLVLDYFSDIFFLNICTSHIKTKELVLASVVPMRVPVFLDYYKQFFNCGERLYVGPFEEVDPLLAKILLVDHVDMEAEYYVFANQKGKAIDVGDFQMIACIDY